MTATKAMVRRAWNVRGMSRRMPDRSGRANSASDPFGPPVPVAVASALGEGVADTTDREDEARCRRVGLDLLAQMADVDVDRLLVLVERLVVAQQLQELAAGVDPARPRGEMAEDLELGRGQRDASLAALDAPALEVDDE